IPAGKDPDELIRTDPDGWRTAVAEAAELLPYFMQRAASEVDMRQAQGRSGYTRRMLDLLRRLPDRVEQDSYVPQLAQLAGIDERVLRDELSRGDRPVPLRPVVDSSSAATGEERLTPLERQALTLLLLSPTLAAEIDRAERLPFRDESAQALGDAWRAAVLAEAKPDLERFVAGLDPATADLARRMLASARARGARPDTTSDREELRICLVRLRIQRAEEQLDDLQALIRAAADDGESNDIRELEQRFQGLTREREQLVRAMRGPALVAGERRS
ncbi:MAG: hypothetical protein ACRDE6_07375, partial [Candidatus Limnocylindria bacterium]